MKRLFLLFLLCALLPTTVTARSEVRPDTLGGYELAGDMPRYVEALKESMLTYPMAWGRSDIRRFDAWRAKARRILLECMGPAPAPAPFEPEVLAEERREGYTAKKVSLNLSRYARVSGYLLLPDGEGPFPAVVMLHDHGAHFSIGKEKVVRPFGVGDAVAEDAAQWAAKCYDGSFPGDFYARHGYAVFATDALMWGERGRREGPDYAAQQAVASCLLQLGSSWTSWILWEDLRSVEFVASLPEVDARRVAAVGFSVGAFRAWMLAAMSDEVAAGVAACWMTLAEAQLAEGGRCKGYSDYANLVPGLRRYLDHPHVASIACPKPMCFFNGRDDRLFPAEAVERAYGEMRTVWRSQGVPERLETRLRETTHVFDRGMQEESLRFLDRWLKNGE